LLLAGQAVSKLTEMALFASTAIYDVGGAGIGNKLNEANFDGKHREHRNCV